MDLFIRRIEGCDIADGLLTGHQLLLYDLFRFGSSGRIVQSGCRLGFKRKIILHVPESGNGIKVRMSGDKTLCDGEIRVSFAYPSVIGHRVDGTVRFRPASFRIHQGSVRSLRVSEQLSVCAEAIAFRLTVAVAVDPCPAVGYVFLGAVKLIIPVFAIQAGFPSCMSGDCGQNRYCRCDQQCLEKSLHNQTSCRTSR